MFIIIIIIYLFIFFIFRFFRSFFAFFRFFSIFIFCFFSFFAFFHVCERGHEIEIKNLEQNQNNRHRPKPARTGPNRPETGPNLARNRPEPGPNPARTWPEPGPTRPFFDHFLIFRNFSIFGGICLLILLILSFFSSFFCILSFLCEIGPRRFGRLLIFKNIY